MNMKMTIKTQYRITPTDQRRKYKSSQEFSKSTNKKVYEMRTDNENCYYIKTCLQNNMGSSILLSISFGSVQ